MKLNTNEENELFAALFPTAKSLNDFMADCRKAEARAYCKEMVSVNRQYAKTSKILSIPKTTQ